MVLLISIFCLFWSIQSKSRYFIDYDVIYGYNHGYPIDICHFFETEYKFVIYKCDTRDSDPNNHFVIKYSHPMEYPNCNSNRAKVSRYKINYTTHPYARHTFNCIGEDNYFQLDYDYYTLAQNKKSVLPRYAPQYFVTNLCIPRDDIYGMDSCHANTSVATYTEYWNDKCDPFNGFSIKIFHINHFAPTSDYASSEVRKCIENGIDITSIPTIELNTGDLIPMFSSIDSSDYSMIITLILIAALVIVGNHERLKVFLFAEPTQDNNQRMKQIKCGNFTKCKSVLYFTEPHMKTLCSGCKQIHYCSHQCHKWHWKHYHRYVCHRSL